MFKSLLVLTALAVTAPSVAFAQQTPPDPKGAPGGPAVINVNPPGLSNNPNGVPVNPAVFSALRGIPNSGQPTGGSPPPGPPEQRGVVTFSPASP